MRVTDDPVSARVAIVPSGAYVNVDKRRGGVRPDYSRVTCFQTTSFGSGMVVGFLPTKYLQP